MTRAKETISLTVVVALLAVLITVTSFAWSTVSSIKDDVATLRERVGRIEGTLSTVAQRTGVRFDRDRHTAKAEEQ